MSNIKKTEPISILKNSSINSPPFTFSHSTRIMLSDEEEDPNKKDISDGENDEEEDQPMSAEALELLNAERVIKAGYLLKKGEKRRSWKKRWFVLKSTKLAMYKDDKEYKLLRIIDLEDIHKVVQVTSKHKYKFVFAFVTAKRMYYVQAHDKSEMEDWFNLVIKAKNDLLLIEDDTSSMNRDQEYAKDIVSSYNSNHATNFMKNIDEVSNKTNPIDISQKKRQDTGLSEYSVSRIYPLSPSFEEHDHHAAFEGIASSEDEEEVNDDIINILSEENRNRVLIEGYLLKLGRIKGWRKRWFVLRTDTLAYYTDEKEYSPHKIIPLANIMDSLEIDPISKSKQYCFKIITPNRNYVLCSPSEEDMDAWLNALSVSSRRIEKETESITSTTTTSAAAVEERSGISPILEESDDHLSIMSGSGGFGGAGGALGNTTPNLTHLKPKASERLGRA